MQTHSHFLMTAALNRVLQHRQVIVHRNPFLLGAVLPDVPFWLLTAWGEIYYTWFARTPTGESPMIYLHLYLYFNDPLWITVKDNYTWTSTTITFTHQSQKIGGTKGVSPSSQNIDVERPN